MPADNPSTKPERNAQALAEGTETTTSESSSAWKLEDCSKWRLTYFWDPGKSSGWFGNPGNILLLTSVPFFAGAYFGYRMPTEQLEDLIQGSVGDSSSNAKTMANASLKKSPPVDKDAIRVVAARTASKALRIATLGTVGTFGFVGAMGFYMSGFRSLEEAVAGTNRWASSWGRSLEHAMGGDQAISKTHPEVLATKDMNVEDEWRYIYDKYIKEEDGDGKDILLQDDDANDPHKKKEPSPTLYMVYEKYLKRKENS